jgi:PAS domain S-box-containing protein
VEERMWNSMTEPKRILVVDDEERNRKLLRAMLKTLGYGFEGASDGFDALSKIKSGVDLVLLDVMMPGMDGFQVVRRIREDPDCGDIPVIMVTILSSKEDRLRAVEAGANDFIPKPIDEVELRVRIASLLKMKEAQDAIKRHRAELEMTVEKRTRALRESEERFRAIFEIAEDCIFVKDRSLRYSHVNPAMEKLLEVPGSKLIGKTDLEIFGEDVALAIQDADLRVMNGELVEGEQKRMVNGTPVIFHEIRMPMADSSGNVIGLCGIARNITDLKLASAHPVSVDTEYRSKAVRETLAALAPVKMTDSIVLLTGESGSGKDYFAQYIHDNSKRSTGPFFSVNCAAVSSELAESELFGHEAGAFTGAVRKKKGLLELAEGGSLLLNEIGELSLRLQAKLLTFLDSRTFTRVGGEKSVTVNARLIAATNRDLEKEVAQGSFRSDLFYRLNVFRIRVPPLRERTDDIPILVNSLLSELKAALQLQTIREIDAPSMERLQRYPWPGNVRELKNVLERALILSTGVGPLSIELPGAVPDTQHSIDRWVVKMDDPSGHWTWKTGFPPELPLGELARDLKRSVIEESLRRSGGKKTDAAVLLGVTRAALKRQMQTLGFGGSD